MNAIQQAIREVARTARVEGFREAEKRRWTKPTLKVAMAHREARDAATKAFTTAMRLAEGTSDDAA